MVIIGIDPGIERMGFGVIRRNGDLSTTLDYGCIKTKKDKSSGERLHELCTDLALLLRKWRPDAAVIEELFFAKNVRTAMTVAQSRGVILECFEEYGVPVYSFPPQVIKAAVTGNGRADKNQVKIMVRRLLQMPSPILSDDAADALAAALCLTQHHTTAACK